MGEGGGAAMRRTAKDSVFCDLFSRPEYVLALYRSLHPEDSSVGVGDVDIVTIRRALTDGLYNDLGFAVGGRLLVLVEAQSTWSPNVALRALLYAAETLGAWARRRELNLYSSRPVCVPRPELYVVYTGRARSVPGTLALSDALGWGGGPSGVEARVRVLRGGPGILGEYVGFTRVLDSCRARLGATEEAARAVVGECVERGILRDYMLEREDEVVGIMMLLFNDEDVQRGFLAEAAREARAEGLSEGRAEFLGRAADAVASGLLGLEAAAAAFGFAEDEIRARMS